MRQIEGVCELEIGNTKVFVIEGQKNLLIDTGSGPMHDEVLAFMENSGLKLDDPALRNQMKQGASATIIEFLQQRNITIDTIICTHWHGDHTGNAKQLKEVLQAPLAMHPHDAPYVDGTAAVPAPAFVPAEIIRHMQVEPCGVDIQLQDGRFVTPDLQVIHVAGHTKGSICLLYKNRALIAGDCLVGKNETNPMMGSKELNPPIQMFSMDYAQALRSMQKLLHYDFCAILTCHGSSVRENAKAKLEKLIRDTPAA